MPTPSVCVVLPCLNERHHINACLESLLGQTYAGPLEIIVADGGSSDGTVEILERWAASAPNVAIVENPARLQSVGVWKAALVTDAEILVRADAHTVYQPDYVERSVGALSSHDAIAVGGRLHPVGESGFGRAVARAMIHPLGIGPAAFHSQDSVGFVDTVYLGTFRRADFLAVGGMRTLPAGVAEDADLYYRWRRLGHRVLLDPAIKSEYRPRDTPSSLWKQFYKYGFGKADMLLVNGEFPSWRPLAPLLLVVGIASSAVLTVWTPFPLLVITGAWLLALAVAMRSPGVILAAGIMQLAYGVGLVRGLFRRPSSVRSAVRENTQPE